MSTQISVNIILLCGCICCVYSSPYCATKRTVVEYRKNQGIENTETSEFEISPFSFFCTVFKKPLPQGDFVLRC